LPLQIFAGVTFVLAWVVGLILAPNGPKPDDSAVKIAHYFATNEHKAMVAHFLIDGLAGVAIIAIAVSLHSYLDGEQQLRAILLWSGVAAGLASLGRPPREKRRRRRPASHPVAPKTERRSIEWEASNPPLVLINAFEVPEGRESRRTPTSASSTLDAGKARKRSKPRSRVPASVRSPGRCPTSVRIQRSTAS
jgi:hypothetical protein